MTTTQPLSALTMLLSRHTRRAFIALLAVIAWPRGVIAQKAEKTRRIVMLTGIAEADPEGQARVAALQEGLRDLGWIAGQNVLIEYRWGAGDEGRMAALAREAVELQPDLIIGATTPVIIALLQQTRTVPIVFVQVTDPLGRGFKWVLGLVSDPFVSRNRR